MISRANLKRMLRYNPRTGVFTWLIDAAASVTSGSVAGGIDEKGYWRICINGRKYRAHRLAFLYMTGRWPKRHVDHRDMKRSNNRWRNLREATRSQNHCNSGPRRNNKCGFKGVYKRKDGTFLAQIQHNKKKFYIGLYKSAMAAHAAYLRMARKLHGNFARGSR